METEYATGRKQQMTFSQVAQATLASVRGVLALCPALKPNRLMIRAHARGILGQDGTPDAPGSLVDPVVYCVEELLAERDA
jgi:hypothetical protein